MQLLIRMALYYIFGALSGLGWLHWDQITNTVTIQLDDAIPALIGAAGFALTFIWSRVVKRRGGET